MKTKARVITELDLKPDELVGKRVVLLRQVDRFPVDLIPEGLTGRITLANESSIVVTLTLERPTLKDRDNSIYWTYVTNTYTNFFDDVALIFD